MFQVQTPVVIKLSNEAQAALGVQVRPAVLRGVFVKIKKYIGQRYRSMIVLGETLKARESCDQTKS